MDDRRAAGARLGSVMQARRRAAGLTQQQLADRSGLSLAAVRDLEQGRSVRPRKASLAALAGALGLDASQMATLTAAGGGSGPHSAGQDVPAGHGSGLWLAALGPLAAWRDGLPVVLGPPRQAAVLALLAVQPGRFVRRETIIDALWGQDPPTTAADLVQAHVSRLRRLLNAPGHPQLLEQGTAGYRLRAEADELDVAAFTGLAGRARAAAEAGDGAAACHLYGQALGLWRGEPAANAGVLRGHPAVRGLAQRRAQAVLGYADVACELGWHTRVIPLLEALAEEEPLDERVHARLMVALAGTGQQAAALSVYAGLTRRLDDDLGMGPGPELAAAHRRVLRQDIPPQPTAGTAEADDASASSRPQAGPGVRYSLPPDTAAFTGRKEELDRIADAAASAAGTGGVVAIHAIGGMPGVGKTALAVHAAHLVSGRFPDRQLFVSLHAHTPGRDPVTPEAALAGLLAAVGTDPRNLPDDLDGRTALWRDRMAGQKAILVLDNAASSSQVAPLLPGSDGCLVLVTSRRHLADLPGAASPVLLEALPPGEARELFTRLAPRAASGPPEAVAELAELAGFLPLAVSLLARVYARHPSWTLADLVAETRGRMLTLTAEHHSIAAALGVSYQHLDPRRQDLFRRLGLHPGITIDAYAAAALAGCSLDEAVGELDALYGEGLLTEVGRHRYGMHDLVRRYARDLAATDPAGRREQALGRLLDYYQHTATRAEAHIARRPRPGPADPPPRHAPALAGPDAASEWLRTERANLEACLRHAAGHGQDARLVTLSAALATLLDTDGPWPLALATHTAAAAAAGRLGNRRGQASALTDLGRVRQLTGDYAGAARDQLEALELSREPGDRLGQASALTQLGQVRLFTGDHPGAARDLREALELYRELGDRLGQASALTLRGEARALTGDYPGAARDQLEAIELHRELGNRRGLASALARLGQVRQLTGDYPGAARDQLEALELSRELGDRLGQASALTRLGELRLLTGDYPGAARDLQETLELCRELGSRRGQANALGFLGRVRQLTGDYPGAARNLQEALELFRGVGSRGGEAWALNHYAAVLATAGEPARALAVYRDALRLTREVQQPDDEALSLEGIGECLLREGAADEGAEHLALALAIFQRLGMQPDIERVQARIDALITP